ncbi:hypothetical protein CR513_30939, partial [Mucuna pruriens]
MNKIFKNKKHLNDKFGIDCDKKKDKSTSHCLNCRKFGHFSYDCSERPRQKGSKTLRTKKKGPKSDHGEFENENFQRFYEESDILHKFFAPRTPQQNGAIEKKNKPLHEMARIMRFHQMNIKRVFLNDINEEVYVEQPLGFKSDSFPNNVFKLKKALFDLKQAPHAWYEN